MTNKIIGGIIVAAIIIAVLHFFILPDILPDYVAWKNEVEHTIRKADDRTNYETRKKVEDTCRAMQASYEADKLTWEQYRESESEEKRGWAEQAKMRANRTAATYNTFILENGYVWEGNIPRGITHELPYLKED